MPLLTTDDDLVWVGRIREDFTVSLRPQSWVVGDQIRKGAALNTVQIAEELVKRDLV
jgi:aspartate-semialdehyde dehydrogenase